VGQRNLFDPIDDFPDEGIGDAGDDHPDGVGSSGNQAARHGADGIALLAGDLMDDGAGRGLHQGAVAKGPRDGGMGDMSGARDVLDRDHLQTCSG
jgi:hypothetical protein